MNSSFHKIGQTALCLFGVVSSAAAMEVDPEPTHIQAAVDRGKRAAALQQSPDKFYVRFGDREGLYPGGFLITKLGGLSVMATHMALRGLEPTAADIAQVTGASTMLVSAIIFGDTPDFAVNSYMILDQGGPSIKPLTVRADGQAARSKTWPASPQFQAKVVATFKYADFDPHARTIIAIFPARGGEVSFQVNFAELE